MTWLSDLWSYKIATNSWRMLYFNPKNRKRRKKKKKTTLQVSHTVSQFSQLVSSKTASSFLYLMKYDGWESICLLVFTSSKILRPKASFVQGIRNICYFFFHEIPFRLTILFLFKRNKHSLWILFYKEYIKMIRII